MITVWMRVDPVRRATRFHRTPDCRQLQKKPACGSPRELIEIDVSEVEVRPCGTCYPDAPRMAYLKRWCTICESRHPCEHNGGVLVIDRGNRRFWVWPDANQ